MAEPQTPGEARRQGLKKSRWIAAGVAVGSAAFLTGVIAGVNGADGSSADSEQISSVVPGGSQQTPQFGDDGRSDDGGSSYDDDFGSARPFDPQGSSQQLPSTDSQSGSGSTQQSPSGGPQTRSGGS